MLVRVCETWPPKADTTSESFEFFIWAFSQLLCWSGWPILYFYATTLLPFEKTSDCFQMSHEVLYSARGCKTSCERASKLAFLHFLPKFIFFCTLRQYKFFWKSFVLIKLAPEEKYRFTAQFCQQKQFYKKVVKAEVSQKFVLMLSLFYDWANIQTLIANALIKNLYSKRRCGTFWLRISSA